MSQIVSKPSWWGGVSSLGVLIASWVVSPVAAADRLYVTYGSLLELDLPVAELEIYAKEGRLSPNLEPYTQALTPEQLQQVQKALQVKLEVPSLALASFLKTSTGQYFLERTSQIVRSKSQGASPALLGTALVKAAADPNGLTILTLLRNFPDPDVQVDVVQGLEIVESVSQLIQRTQKAIAVIQNQAQATSNPNATMDAALLRTWQQPGPFAVQTQTLTLKDRRPERLNLTGNPRNYPVDLYLPQQAQPSPIIVISHGLGEDRLSFAYFARHLASHGFGVAVPEHPGSSAKQVMAVLESKTDRVSAPTEFVDRPLDITYLLNQLEERSQTNPQLRGRLQLDHVGVMGHSYGGYTALALAGAPFNWSQLQQDCGPTLAQTLNVSLLLQCQVLTLPQRTYALRDPRVKAVLAVNPLTSSVFGPTGLQQIQPAVMMVAAGADTITPALLEQIQPFTGLTGPHNYLVLMKAATHFSTIGESETDPRGILADPFVGPSPEVAQDYLKGLGLAFFRAHVLNQPQAQALLNSASVEAWSQPSFAIALVQRLKAADLATRSQR